MSDRDDAASEASRFSVLEVFGIKLEVSNPRVAELLTMDAKEALSSDLRDLGTPAGAPPPQQASVEVTPEAILAPTPTDESYDEQTRVAFRERVVDLGIALGFDVEPSGLWESPTGVSILTRCMGQPVSLEAANRFVTEIATRREQLGDSDSAVLFVTGSQQSADVFKVAIRQSRLYDAMRVICIDDLDDIQRLYDAKAIDHARAMILLAPAANIDVGEILSVIRAATTSQD